MKYRFYHLTAAVLLLPLLLFGCGGAEDGDLTPPDFTFDGIQSPTSDPDGHSLSGTVDPEATLEVEVNTTATISNLSVSGGFWSFDIDGLVEGLNTISIDVSDPIGNSTIYFVNIVLDTTGPTVTLDQYADFTQSTTQMLAGNLGEVNADVEYCIEDGTTVCDPLDDAVWTAVAASNINGTVWQQEVDLPDGGTYGIQIRAIDFLGNETDSSEYATAQIVVDSINAPLFSVTQSLPVYLPDPLNSGEIILDGTYDSTNYDLLLTTSPLTTFIFNQDAPLGADTWTLDFNELPAGSTVATFSILDTISQDEVARANVLLVRDQSRPLLVETIPGHGDENVQVSNPVVLTFSEKMAPIVNDGTIFELVANDGTTVSFTENPSTTDFRKFSFLPDTDTPLQPDTKYTVNFFDTSTAVVEDVYGNDFVRPTGLWVFTTAP